MGHFTLSDILSPYFRFFCAAASVGVRGRDKTVADITCQSQFVFYIQDAAIAVHITDMIDPSLLTNSGHQTNAKIVSALIRFAF